MGDIVKFDKDKKKEEDTEESPLEKQIEKFKKLKERIKRDIAKHNEKVKRDYRLK